MVETTQTTEGAKLVDIRSIITPVSEVAKPATQVAQAMTPPNDDTGDYIDKVLKGLELVNNMLEKGDKLEGVFGSIAERKGVVSREENKPDNPVLSEKREPVVHAQDAPAKPLAGKPINGVEENKQEVVYMPAKINEEYVAECVKSVEEMLTKSVPEKYQEKTVKELLAYLNKPIVGDMIRKTVYKELLAIVQGAVENEKTKGESAEEKTE